MKKITFPLGAEPRPSTVAVRVTLWAAVDGFEDEPRMVALGRLTTVCVTGEEVFGLKLPSPE
jgi:hypothetical protein